MVHATCLLEDTCGTNWSVIVWPLSLSVTVATLHRPIYARSCRVPCSRFARLRDTEIILGPRFCFPALARIPNENAMTSMTVEFYFDPVSPYAWLAAEQLSRVTAAGGDIVCRPILLAALLNAHGTKGPAEVPAKREYVFRDVMRQAKRLGLPFCGPPSHPFNPLAALRAILAVEGEAQRLVLTRRLLAAVWSEGIDIADPETLSGVLSRSGFDSAALLAAAATPEVKQRLRSFTQEAIDARVFGVPTFRLHGELFWGADRLDTLVWALKGGSIDDDLYQCVLRRPTTASR